MGDVLAIEKRIPKPMFSGTVLHYTTRVSGWKFITSQFSTLVYNLLRGLTAYLYGGKIHLLSIVDILSIASFQSTDQHISTYDFFTVEPWNWINTPHIDTRIPAGMSQELSKWFF